MPSPATVQVIGLRELRKALKDAEPEERKAIRAALREGANVVVPIARRRAPNVSGALSRSVRSSAGMTSSAVMAGGLVKVQYAGPINFGWPRRNIKPQEFMYSAVAEAQDTIHQVFEGLLEDALGRVFGGL